MAKAGRVATSETPAEKPTVRAKLPRKFSGGGGSVLKISSLLR